MHKGKKERRGEKQRKIGWKKVIPALVPFLPGIGGGGGGGPPPPGGGGGGGTPSGVGGGGAVKVKLTL